MICQYGCNQKAKYQLKSGKWCCSKHYQGCPSLKEKNSISNSISRKGKPSSNPHFHEYNKMRRICQYCKKDMNLTNIKHHERVCYLNPENLKFCPLCNSPVKNYRGSVTCSHKCGNRYFKDKITKARKLEDKYIKSARVLCFRHHKHECIICNEKNIVEAHHYDGDRNNNKPSNLVPLCPTHHKYIHRRYKKLIQEKVDLYIKSFAR